jgi:hypothetical protein
MVCHLPTIRTTRHAYALRVYDRVLRQRLIEKGEEILYVNGSATQANILKVAAPAGAAAWIAE